MLDGPPFTKEIAHCQEHAPPIGAFVRNACSLEAALAPPEVKENHIDCKSQRYDSGEQVHPPPMMV